MILQPLGNKVLVRLDTGTDDVRGGIVIPDQARETARTGTVKAVGAKCVEIKRGDSVLLPKYGGTDIKSSTDMCRLISESDVLGVINHA